MQVDDLCLYLQCLSSKVFFKHFAGKNQLPGLSASGRNRLMNTKTKMRMKNDSNVPKCFV